MRVTSTAAASHINKILWLHRSHSMVAAAAAYSWYIRAVDFVRGNFDKYRPFRSNAELSVHCTVRNRGNSAIADKPRDAFMQAR